ncbi:hypothetical protein HYE34_04025 [Mycoplasmopsis bovis]|nr:hypothetical protein HYE34_04025 [Mycoplasmopsis bovis]
MYLDLGYVGVTLSWCLFAGVPWSGVYAGVSLIWILSGLLVSFLLWFHHI